MQHGIKNQDKHIRAPFDKNCVDMRRLQNGVAIFCIAGTGFMVSFMDAHNKPYDCENFLFSDYINPASAESHALKMWRIMLREKGVSKNV